MIKQKGELYSELNRLDDLMPAAKFSFGFAYDMVRLSRENDSIDVSGYMSKKQLLTWMRAYRAGYYAAKEFKKQKKES